MCPSRYDPFPFVVAETLASGTPVIASPHGASLTFYNEAVLRPLLISSTDDLEGFEQAVQQVLSDPQRWRELIQSKGAPTIGRDDGPGELVEPISARCRHVRRAGFTGGLPSFVMRSYVMPCGRGRFKINGRGSLDMVFSNARKKFRNFALLLQERSSSLQPVPNALIVGI
jgi:hypothetical protein